MSLINREALYEKVCGLEAQALSYIEKIIHDEDKVEEWKIWSAILTERTAFKHDIFDAPEVKPERKTGQWIPCSERLPDKPNVYMVTDHDGRVVRYVYNDNESSREYWKRCAKAWMPLPEPYREGDC